MRPILQAILKTLVRIVFLYEINIRKIDFITILRVNVQLLQFIP